PGWGNTTQALLQTGYDVTAVEIDPAFIDLIAQRCALHADRLTLETADMMEFTSTHRFDVILFFESFHHCQDHRRLLRQLHDLLAEGGVILFVAEPIVDLPYPWGLRLDGQSLWAIRQLGWLELGFDRSYFMQALRDTGWPGGPSTRSGSTSPRSKISNVLRAAIRSQRRHPPTRSTGSSLARTSWTSRAATTPTAPH